MDEARKFEMSEDELETKLLNIRNKYRIDANLLFNLLNNPKYSRIMNQNLSKHARRKLQRGLKGSDLVFRKIEDIIAQHAESLQSIPDEYRSFIYSKLNPDQRRAYDSGCWTIEVLEVVSSAQRAYYHNRAPSPAETEPRVKFAPTGNYRKSWNR